MPDLPQIQVGGLQTRRLPPARLAWQSAPGRQQTQTALRTGVTAPTMTLSRMTRRKGQRASQRLTRRRCRCVGWLRRYLDTNGEASCSSIARDACMCPAACCACSSLVLYHAVRTRHQTLVRSRSGDRLVRATANACAAATAARVTAAAVTTLQSRIAVLRGAGSAMRRATRARRRRTASARITASVGSNLRQRFRTVRTDPPFRPTCTSFIGLSV